MLGSGLPVLFPDEAFLPRYRPGALLLFISCPGQLDNHSHFQDYLIFWHSNSLRSLEYITHTSSGVWATLWLWTFPAPATVLRDLTSWRVEAVGRTFWQFHTLILLCMRPGLACRKNQSIAQHSFTPRSQVREPHEKNSTYSSASTTLNFDGPGCLEVVVAAQSTA